MTANSPDPKRRMLPRFRNSAAAVASGDLCGLVKKDASPARPVESPHFDALKKVWMRAPSLDTAIDLVCSGVVLGRIADVRDAAQLIIKERAEVNLRIVEAASKVLMGVPNADARGQTESPTLVVGEPQIRASLAVLKHRLNENPRNPIAWMDRAHLHTLIGQKEAAARAVRRALVLAPSNRFVVRAASRFFVHADEPDAGLNALRSSPALRSDPWIMAAEIAMSNVVQESPISFLRARSLVSRDDLQPWHTSELNGAIGTLAMSDRSIGKPGAFFRKSLRDATENAVAQAQWFANESSGFEMPNVVDSRWSPEAYALKARSEKKWNEVVTACKQWMLMDPASTRPLILAGFVACVALNDGALALPFTEHWIRLEPNSPSAWNNHVVALAYAGAISQAKEAFDRIPNQNSDGFPDAVYLATKGMLAYRSGEVSIGRELYLEAARSDRAQKDPTLKALVLWHLLREEARVGAPKTSEALAFAWEHSKSLAIPELESMKATVEKSANQSLGRRLVVTFQGGSSLAPLILPSWD